MGNTWSRIFTSILKRNKLVKPEGFMSQHNFNALLAILFEILCCLFCLAGSGRFISLLASNLPVRDESTVREGNFNEDLSLRALY